MRSRRPGDGFPTLVGDKLLIMGKPGVLRVAEASPEGYRELASVDLFDEVSWSAPAFAGGSIYLRSMDSLARVDPAVVEMAATPEEIAGSQPESLGFAAFLAELAGLEDGEKAARVDAFLAPYVAGDRATPIIEASGEVHFLYRGEVGDVSIIGDHIGFRREDPMTRVPGTDIFVSSTRLEPDVAIYYGFLVDYGDPAADPLNPQPGSGLFGDVSRFEMPGYASPGDFSTEAADERRGRLEEISWESEILEGQTRKAQVYLPAGYDSGGDRRYPALYVQDGGEALEIRSFPETPWITRSGSRRRR